MMFTSVVSSFLSSFFNMIYQLFSITIPGTTVSFFQLGIGVIVTVFVIGIAYQFTNFGISISSAHFGSKGGNNPKRKVSEKRKGDVK